MTGQHTWLPTNTLQKIGNTVERIRIARNLSKRQVATELGMSTGGTYMKMVRGERLSEQSAMVLRAWIVKWVHVLEKKTS